MPPPWKKQKADLLQQIRDLKNALHDRDRKIGAQVAIDVLERKVAALQEEIAVIRSELEVAYQDGRRYQRKLEETSAAVRALMQVAVEEA